jgi:hypothetical protein
MLKSKYTHLLESAKNNVVESCCDIKHKLSQYLERIVFVLCYFISSYAFSNVIFHKFLPVFGALANPVSWFVFIMLFLFYAKSHIVTLGRDIQSLLSAPPTLKGGAYIRFCNNCIKYYAKCLWRIVSATKSYLLGQKIEKAPKLDRKSHRWLKEILSIYQSESEVEPLKTIIMNEGWKESLDWSNKKVSYEEVQNIRADLYSEIKALSALSTVKEFQDSVSNVLTQMKGVDGGPNKKLVNLVSDQLELDMEQIVGLLTQHKKDKNEDVKIYQKLLNNLMYKRIKNDVKASQNEYLVWLGPYFGTINSILNGATNATMMFFGGGGSSFSVITSFVSGFFQSNTVTKPRAIKTFSFMSAFYFKQLNREQIFAFFLGLIMAVASGVLNYCLWSPYLVGLKGTVIVAVCCVYAGVFAFGLYAHSTVKNSDEMVKIVCSVFKKSKIFCAAVLKPLKWPKIISGFCKNISMKSAFDGVKNNFNEVVADAAGIFMALYYGLMVYEKISSYIVAVSLTVAIFPVWRALFKTTLMDILLSSQAEIEEGPAIKRMRVDVQEDHPGALPTPTRKKVFRIVDTPGVTRRNVSTPGVTDRNVSTPGVADRNLNTPVIKRARFDLTGGADSENPILNTDEEGCPDENDRAVSPNPQGTTGKNKDRGGCSSITNMIGCSP